MLGNSRAVIAVHDDGCVRQQAAAVERVQQVVEHAEHATHLRPYSVRTSAPGSLRCCRRANSGRDVIGQPVRGSRTQLAVARRTHRDSAAPSGARRMRGRVDARGCRRSAARTTAGTWQRPEARRLQPPARHIYAVARQRLTHDTLVGPVQQLQRTRAREQRCDDEASLLVRPQRQLLDRPETCHRVSQATPRDERRSRGTDPRTSTDTRCS